MAWTLPVTVALVCLAAILMFLAKAFNKEQRWIKVLLIMFSLGTTILISQMMRIIIDANATGTVLKNLQKMTTVSLTITITLFSFFVAYFLIIYTIYIITALRDAKQKKRYGDEDGDEDGDRDEE